MGSLCSMHEEDKCIPLDNVSDKHRWEDTIKVDVKNAACEDVGLFCVQSLSAGCCE
jgi:hypothetical protein